MCLGVLACNSEPAATSGPGRVVGALVSPNGAEGAVVLELVGSGLGAISAEEGIALAGVAGDVVRVVVVRERPGRIEFTIQVADLSSPPSVRIVEVAGPDDRLRSGLAGYGIALTPVRSAR